MGMKLKLLKRKSFWYLVQTPYEYIGWITAGTIERYADNDIEQWNQARKYVVTANFAQVYENPSENSNIVCDVVLGCVVKELTAGKTWSEIMLPDGRTGYLKMEQVRPEEKPAEQNIPDQNRIVQTARRMMGIPYLWGGHSTKGFDCSGFTRTVFSTAGYQLPRDANMQVDSGEEIIPEENFANILPGDLIFFGPEGRITHVGICLGGADFIHCSGDVHINSLAENDERFNAYRKRTFRVIKRIIKN